jgi:hypothetical protein
MAEVILSTTELAVLGGPSSIVVSTDFGVQGDRGSLILFGDGKPDIVNPQDTQLFDMYINLLTTDDEYLYLYQYVSTDVGNVWERRVKLLPNIHSVNKQVTFVDGEVTVNIPIYKIALPQMVSNPVASNFNIQHSVSGTAPIASSVTIEEVVITSQEIFLPVTIRAAEFVDNSWQSIADQRIVYLMITVV